MGEPILCRDCGKYLRSAYVPGLRRRSWWCPECSTPPGERYIGAKKQLAERTHDGEETEERPVRPWAGVEGVDDLTGE